MFRALMRRPLLQLTCILTLLVAQQGALTHALWHAHGGEAAGHVHHHDTDGDPQPHGDESSRQGELCGFDTAFGQVLGVAGGQVAWFAAPALRTGRAGDGAGIRDGLPRRAPRSRGPPPRA